ncbi:PTS sugar transporter subunit IIA [Alicyclobacillaceae bacterium I2511]|nr:PTS sugar transporter subunit IIA [Alicyclobacillaceae bacterium I2511]
MKELSSEEEFVQLKTDHVRLRADYANWTEAIRGSAALFTKEEVTDGFLEALLLREKQYPTGLPVYPYGVAIPHPEPDVVLRPSIALVTLVDPVPFKMMGSPDEEVLVSIVITLALPKKDHEQQATFLAQIIERVQDESWARHLMEEAKTSTDALMIFKSI